MCIPGAPRRALWLMLTLAAVALVAIACGGDDDADQPTLFIGGIPDQDVSTLERQFNLLADYLSDETGLKVAYRASTDYAAIVTAFARDDVQLGWFGGLTGVQARERADAAVAIAQRPRDAAFHSVFIVRVSLADEVMALADLRDRSFTFGSESSTSGHLMPRFFLGEAGIDADRDFDGLPNFSGSHDRTITLVESGAFDAGALNEAVWDRAVETGAVDTTKVVAFLRTPPYFDYHFVAQGNLDERYGAGTTASIREALLRLTPEQSADGAALLEIFATDRFVPTEDANYDAIRDVARGLGILEAE